METKSRDFKAAILDFNFRRSASMLKQSIILNTVHIPVDFVCLYTYPTGKVRKTFEKDSDFTKTFFVKN